MESQVTVRDVGGTDLRKGFDAFIEAARRLESSYARLEARAASVDLQLAETNRTLDQTLRERDAIFAAVPIGLLTLSDSDTVTWRNAEAERLCEAGGRLGLELTAAREGEIAAPGLAVRVRRIDLLERGELVILEDRSRVVHLEREVDRLDRLAGLSELALGIAHEIKNPLNGVMGFAALMERSDDPFDCRRYAGKIRQGLEQVDGIVKALLGFARPQGEESSSETLQALVAAAASGAGVPAARVSLSGDVLERAESGALVRVLDNLFRNSVEAGGDSVRIEVAVTVSGDELEILVSDDGPGVPVDLGQSVFEPFVSSKSRGHGLGLALSARIIGFLGGALDLLNPGEAGAVFRIRVPRAVPREPRGGRPAGEQRDE